MVTHKHPHTEAEIREETAPGLPIISAEVYGRRELRGITEIKLHRQGTSNTGKKKKKNFRGSGENDGLGTERERYGSSVRERCITSNSPSTPRHAWLSSNTKHGKKSGGTNQVNVLLQKRTLGGYLKE